MLNFMLSPKLTNAQFYLDPLASDRKCLPVVLMYTNTILEKDEKRCPSWRKLDESSIHVRMTRDHHAHARPPRHFKKKNRKGDAGLALAQAWHLAHTPCPTARTPATKWTPTYPGPENAWPSRTNRRLTAIRGPVFVWCTKRKNLDHTTEPFRGPVGVHSVKIWTTRTEPIRGPGVVGA